jgi:thioredoxin reductase
MPERPAKSVAIIGAGPVGLAAAAHVLEYGLTPHVLEAGPEIGHAIRQWGHVQLFSPWEYNIDGAAARLLKAAGWNSPTPQDYPTGRELIENYLEPLGRRTALHDHIHTSSRVTAISRAGFDKVKTKGRESAPFEIQFENGAGAKSIEADAVIDASGAWFSPNPAGANGVSARGELAASRHISYGMPDIRGDARSRYAGKVVAVAGSGHSAIGTLIELVRLRDEEPGTSVIWLLRGNNPEKSFGGGANDRLAARGELGALFAELVRNSRLQVEKDFRIGQLEQQDNKLRVISGKREIVVDELIVATGFRPDLSFLRELRIELDATVEAPPALAPLIDPNEHSCGTVRPHGARELSQPEPGFYFAGMKSYGRAPTFLMVTGYEQVRSIVAEIAGDHAAAARSELVLPETGVCSRSVVAAAETACCGGAPKNDPTACCKADEVAKLESKAGCGCAT